MPRKSSLDRQLGKNAAIAFIQNLREEFAEKLGPLWEPNPDNVPQQKAYVSKADRMYYGGSAGGGKTDLIIGLSLTAHTESIIFRREYPQLLSIISRFDDLLKGTGATYNFTRKLWRQIPGNRSVELGAVQLEKDKEKFQGRPHDLVCLAKGEKILMGDGSSKPIEAIQVGEKVMTLIGPKKVTRVMNNGVKDCCKLVTPDGSLTLTWDHKLLTPYGWVSPDELISIRSHVSGSTSELSTQFYPTVLQPYAPLSRDPLLQPALAAQTLLGSQRRGTCALLEDGQSGSGVFGDEPRADLLLPWLSGLVKQPIQPLLSDLKVFSTQFGVNAPLREQAALSTLDYLAGYLNDSRFGDERFVQMKAIVPTHTQLQGDVVEHYPNLTRLGDLVSTPERNHSRVLFAHPYKMDVLESQLPVSCADIEIYPAGDRTVFDLTIEGASHFISSSNYITISNCFDEITHFTRSQFEFLIGWNRTSSRAPRDQRCRIVCTGNPPVTPEGQWVMEYWAPWLDSEHELYPHPPGELIWYASVGGKDTIVSVGDERPPNYILNPGTEFEEEIEPHSRTFIAASLTDNPYLNTPAYRANLQGLPEPLRSQLLFGSFQVEVVDHPWQVIPSAWVEDAFARWRAWPKDQVGGATAMGVDVARGGDDETIISIRRSNYFDELITFPGSNTPDGPKVAAQILKNYKSGIISIDATGVGGSPYDSLRGVVPIFPIGGGEMSKESTRNGNLGFFNKKSEMIWKLREALDPDFGQMLALPPDNRLKAELCAYHWSVRPPSTRQQTKLGELALKGQIQVDEKRVVKEKLGRSPDRMDALLLAHQEAPAVRKSTGSSRAGW